MVQQEQESASIRAISEMSWGAFQVQFADIPVVMNLEPEQAQAIIAQAKADGRYEGFSNYRHRFGPDNDYGRLIPDVTAQAREQYEARGRKLRRVGAYDRPYARHRGKGIIYAEVE